MRSAAVGPDRLPSGRSANHRCTEATLAAEASASRVLAARARRADWLQAATGAMHPRRLRALALGRRSSD